MGPKTKEQSRQEAFHSLWDAKEELTRCIYRARNSGCTEEEIRGMASCNYLDTVIDGVATSIKLKDRKILRESLTGIKE